MQMAYRDLTENSMPRSVNKQTELPNAFNNGDPGVNTARILPTGTLKLTCRYFSRLKVHLHNTSTTVYCDCDCAANRRESSYIPFGTTIPQLQLYRKVLPVHTFNVAVNFVTQQVNS